MHIWPPGATAAATARLEFVAACPVERDAVQSAALAQLGDMAGCMSAIGQSRAWEDLSKAAMHLVFKAFQCGWIESTLNTWFPSILLRKCRYPTCRQVL